MSLFNPSPSTGGRYLGVDIGHDNIKVVETEIARGRGRVLRAGIAPTPLHAVTEGQVVMPEVVGQAVRDLIGRLGISARESIGTVTGSSVFVRPVSVLRQKPNELAQTLVLEAQKYVSTTPEESYFDAPILPDPPGQAPGPEMAVLLVVAPRSLVDGRVVAMEMAGLEPIAMDVNALSAIRVLMPPEMPSAAGMSTETAAFVDMGASYTEVTIVQGHVPVFTRTINIGGTSFTNALAGVLGVEFLEAERIKHRLDIGAIDEGSPDETASRVINSLLEELVRDIRRSLAYHASTLGWESIEGLVDRVFLIGGGSQLAHAADYFANVLQMNIEIGAVPSGGLLQVGDAALEAIGSNTPAYLTAMGLSVWPLFAPQGKR